MNKKIINMAVIGVLLFLVFGKKDGKSILGSVLLSLVSTFVEQPLMMVVFAWLLASAIGIDLFGALMSLVNKITNFIAGDNTNGTIPEKEDFETKYGGEVA